MSTIRVKEIKSTNSDPITINGGISADNYYGNSSDLTKKISTVVPVGQGAMTVNSYLNYGVNIIEQSNTANYCVRLPGNPITGGEVQVVNNSSSPIIVYASKENGSINNTFLGEIEIPNDGNLYSFICLKSTSGGQWTTSLNPIASFGTYDSGEITAFISGGTPDTVISASDPTRWVESRGFFSTSWGYNGLFTPLYQIYSGYTGGAFAPLNHVAWRPSRPWAFITKVSVYTNIAFYTQAAFAICTGFNQNYYQMPGYVFLGTGNAGGMSPDGSPPFLYLNQVLTGASTGTTVVTGFTTHAGDQGTYWGELIYSASSRPFNIGNVGIGYVPNPFGSGSALRIDSKYLNCCIQPRLDFQEFKFRYVIEYIRFSNPPPSSSPL